MSRKINKSTVVRADEFKNPKMISKKAFDKLCKDFQFTPSKQLEAKMMVDQIVIEFADWMRDARGKPDRNQDLDWVRKAASDIKKATAGLSKLGPSGRSALKVISHFIGPMLTATWISDNFPGDGYAPERSPLERSPNSIRTPLRGEKGFVEERTLGSRVQFVSHRAVESTVTALEAIEGGLNETLRTLKLQPGSRGGRKPLIYRHYLIMNLAETWTNLERQVSTKPSSDFAHFCYSVVEEIGWPTAGIVSAIPDALADWRHLPRKIRR